MLIDKKKLYNFLKKKGINNLFHANTVTTSATFIKKGGLLSRGYIEKNNLLQTSQKSDTTDKKYGVWDDIFLDVYDLHNYGFGSQKYYRENKYGPVLFVMNIDLLLDNSLPNIRITKENPQYFTSENDSNFISLDEYIKYFDKEPYKKMITIQAEEYVLEFKKYLQEIIIDNNVNFENIDYSKEAYETISKVISEKGLDIKVNYRQCNTKCYCVTNYSGCGSEELQKLFGCI